MVSFHKEQVGTECTFGVTPSAQDRCTSQSVSLTNSKVKPDTPMMVGDRVEIQGEVFAVLRRIWQADEAGNNQLVILLDWPAR